MVAILHLSVALVGLASVANAAPIASDGSLTKRIACAASGKCHSTFGGLKLAGAMVRDEDALYERDEDVEEHLAKRIACAASGKCHSTFGGLKLAGAMVRDEDALYRRDEDVKEYLTKRIACAASGKCPSTFGKAKMAGVVARDEDALYERDEDVEEYLTKRIACAASGKCPSTFGKAKMAGVVARDEEGVLYERDEDDLYERDEDLHERDDDLYERDEDIEEYLTKRMVCAASGKCPSTFGKPKMAGIRARDEDALYERDVIEAILEARGTGSRLLKTLKNHFLP